MGDIDREYESDYARYVLDPDPEELIEQVDLLRKAAKESGCGRVNGLLPCLLPAGHEGPCDSKLHSVAARARTRVKATKSGPDPQASKPPEVPSSGGSSRLPADPKEQPSGSVEQSTLLPLGPRTMEQETALGIDIFGEKV